MYVAGPLMVGGSSNTWIEGSDDRPSRRRRGWRVSRLRSSSRRRSRCPWILVCRRADALLGMARCVDGPGGDFGGAGEDGDSGGALVVDVPGGVRRSDGSMLSGKRVGSG